jgi:hypothetical protein
VSETLSIACAVAAVTCRAISDDRDSRERRRFSLSLFHAAPVDDVRRFNEREVKHREGSGEGGGGGRRAARGEGRGGEGGCSNSASGTVGHGGGSSRSASAPARSSIDVKHAAANLARERLDDDDTTKKSKKKTTTTTNRRRRATIVLQ